MKSNLDFTVLLDGKDSLEKVKGLRIEALPYTLVYEVQDKRWILFEARHESFPVLEISGEVHHVFDFLCEIFKWPSNFEILDLFYLEDFGRIFGLDTEILIARMGKDPVSILKRFESLKKSHSQVLELALQKKIDVRLPDWLASRGFRWNDFFTRVFDKLGGNFNRQKEVIENFGRYFRREKIDPAEFLESIEDLETKLGDWKSFSRWMRTTTQPGFSKALEAKEKLARKVEGELGGNQLARIRFDESLEEEGLVLEFHLEQKSDLFLVQKKIQDLNISRKLDELMQ